MVDAVSSSNAAAASGTGRARLAENFDTFLSLLTTQLKNQDPLAPMDSTQFTQQLVQMTGVEQQLLTNDLLEKLVANTGSGISTAVSLIGKEVRADSDQAALSGGKAEWVYKLDRAATDVKVEVLDSKGRVVQTLAPTDNTAGEHTFKWNGKTANGSSAPDGVYSLRVTAKDSGGATVPTGIIAQGVVTGVQQVDGKTVVTINGAQIPWEKITLIRQAPTSEPGGATTASNNNSATNNSDDEETSTPAAA
ncbi:flagellar hook assembly protein FlgD [Phenylobacterium sp.]|uniref:flagellar hook assembly protein FlgD n=1 Tax=Phenylobacterium sp. TaxID=1871053 RepID=UPI003BAD5C39